MNLSYSTDTETRKYPRVIPSKDVYAVFGRDKCIIGKLCDISMGGVSCRHFTDSENGYDYSSLDLFTLDNELYMSKIPCSVVYSYDLEEDKELQTKIAVKSKRVGIRFDNLNYFHKNQLKTFVDSVTKWN